MLLKNGQTYNIKLIIKIAKTNIIIYVYNIKLIIKIAKTNIIIYVYNKISEINREGKIALATKRAFEQAITQDEYLSRCHEFPTYTNRYLYGWTFIRIKN